MKVLITGASGYIGSALARHLVRSGHAVTGLVRSSGKGAALAALGGQPLVGDVKSANSFVEVALEQDALVHVAFEPGPEMVATDRAAIDSLLAAARRARRPMSLVYTSGVLVLGAADEAPAPEDASTSHAFPAMAWRALHERLVLEAAGPLLTTTVVRPGWVYGGPGGVLGAYFESAVRSGVATYVGDGRNRLALVHRDDLAELYRLVLERRAQGTFHAVDTSTARTEALARTASEVAGRGGATRGVPLEEARRTHGVLADALCLDQWVGSPRASQLGWKPRRPFVELPHEAFAEWALARRAQGG